MGTCRFTLGRESTGQEADLGVGRVKRIILCVGYIMQ